MIIKQSDFHSFLFSSFRHTPSQTSPLLRIILLRPELRPFIIIILISHPFVKRLMIHMFRTSLMPYISLDQYLNPILYTIPNVQNMRFFCCSVYVNCEVSCFYTHIFSFISCKHNMIKCIQLKTKEMIFLESSIPFKQVPDRIVNILCRAKNGGTRTVT